MVSDRDDERISPTDRHVVSVMDSAEGATEDEVLRSLRFLREERGLKPGTKNGPRHFSWFATVVGDYFRQRREFYALLSWPPEALVRFCAGVPSDWYPYRDSQPFLNCSITMKSIGKCTPVVSFTMSGIARLPSNSPQAERI